MGLPSPVVFLAACAVCVTGTAGATTPKKGVWRGVVTLDASTYNAEGGGYEFSFRAVFPGRWVPRSDRSTWIGTLRWTYEAHTNRNDPEQDCGVEGSGSWPVLMEIGDKGFEGGLPTKTLEVELFDEPSTRFGPITGGLTERCPGIPPVEHRGGAARYYLPTIGAMVLQIKKTAKSFKRTVRPVLVSIYGYERKRFPARFAFVKKAR
jgi:hypothetical protein